MANENEFTIRLEADTIAGALPPPAATPPAVPPIGPPEPPLFIPPSVPQVPPPPIPAVQPPQFSISERPESPAEPAAEERIPPVVAPLPAQQPAIEQPQQPLPPAEPEKPEPYLTEPPPRPQAELPTITRDELEAMRQKLGEKAVELAMQSFRVVEAPSVPTPAAEVKAGPAASVAAKPAAGEFDPVAEARKLIEQEERRNAIQEARVQLLKDAGKIEQEQQAKFDPEAQARKLLELEQQRRQILEARDRLTGASLEKERELAELFDRFGMAIPADKEEREDLAGVLERQEKKERQQRFKDVREQFEPPKPPEQPSVMGQAADLARQAGFGMVGRLLQGLDVLFNQFSKPQAAPNQATAASGGGGEGPEFPTSLSEPPPMKFAREVPDTPSTAKIPTVTPVGPSGPGGPSGGGAAAAGGSGAAGLIAGAATIGAVVGVVKIAADMYAGVLNTASQQIINFGDKVAMIADNQNWAAMLKHVDDTAEMFGQIPIVGGVVEAQMKATIAPLKAFTTSVEAFVKRAREIEGFSGPLAVAGAMADVRDLLADIKEAQELGPDLARLVDAQSRASTELREILLPMKRMIVEDLANTLRAITAILSENKSEFGTFAKGTYSATREFLWGVAALLSNGQATHTRLGLILKELQTRNKEEGQKEFVWEKTLNDNLNRLYQGTISGKGVYKPQGVTPNPNTPLNIPAFAGI